MQREWYRIADLTVDVEAVSIIHQDGRWAAAKRLEFEEAATLRDQIKELRELQIYAG